MSWAIGWNGRWFGDRRLPPDEARALMAAVRERAAISFTARAHADSKLQQHLLGLLAAGALGHEQLLAFLRDGEIASLEIGLALHARLDLNQVRQLLYHADRRHLAALCIAASFATPHYITLRMALEIAEEATGAQDLAGAATTRRPSASCSCSMSGCGSTRPSCGCCSAIDRGCVARRRDRRCLCAFNCDVAAVGAVPVPTCRQRSTGSGQAIPSFTHSLPVATSAQLPRAC